MATLEQTMTNVGRGVHPSAEDGEVEVEELRRIAPEDLHAPESRSGSRTGRIGIRSRPGGGPDEA